MYTVMSDSMKFIGHWNVAKDEKNNHIVCLHALWYT
jgi:hypothetical protein